MNPLPKFLCRMVSLLGLGCSIFCLWYIAFVASNVLSSPARKDDPPRFMECYVVLSLVATLIAIGVAVGSINLARLQFRGVRLLTLYSLLPLPVIVIVSFLWLSPLGMSGIAEATGVGLGGLMPMILSLLPLWAGLLWLFVFRTPQSLQQPG